MKYLLFIFTIALLTSCKEDPGVPAKLPAEKRPVNNSPAADAVDGSNTNFNTTEIQPFLDDMKTFVTSEKRNTIIEFKALAENSIAQKIDITKESMANALETAANFEHIFITVEDHTIVKIDDVKKCKPSGSWATCVPYAYGYIKKGEMQYREDYANNIIGLPDTQERVMYLFD